MALAKIPFYRNRADLFLSESQKAHRKSQYISMFRIVSFLGFLILVVLAANRGDLALLILTTILFIILFGVLVNLHDRVRYSMKQSEFLSRINEEEILRIKGNLESFERGGYFLDENHAYHVDLDIFGKNSLFQLLNRTTTFWGRKILASWISEPAAPEEIPERQKAVRELTGDIDWMQEFEATGRHAEVHAETGRFLNWLETETLLLGNRFYHLVRFIGPVLLMSQVILYLFYDFSFMWILTGLAVNVLILLSVGEKIKIIHESTSSSIKSLQSFEALILMIEKKDFLSAKLQDIASFFKPEGIPASRIIGRLRKILLQLDNRNNLIYQLANTILLLDLHFAIAAEKWKKSQPDNIKKWFQKLGEMEALNSLAGYHFANPDYCFPEISSGLFEFEAENMGHPLIPCDHRVNNDLSFQGTGTIVLITGSNMSGKSTFLRTVGINVVLALMGAPVCAGKLNLSCFRVFTGMRTRDNLEENISSFYAELTRIRQLIDFIGTGFAVLFLLDEILKGTNSTDRHLGAVSLVRQLSGEKAAGLISTHDLELARKTMKNPGIINYSFESSILDDEILFDYKIRPGICETFNASKLMEKMGIRLIK
ncbi:MAG: DNA mismatch repair protein MutS [Cyclobacteriaceae bacterium]|nr:DNA mismatch repair protein MutS [Cyclobacteriaceae bacterium]